MVSTSKLAGGVTLSRIRHVAIHSAGENVAVVAQMLGRPARHASGFCFLLARNPPRDEDISASTTPPSNPTIMHLCMSWLIKRRSCRISPRGVSAGAGR
jgi:hypothetical protein